MVGQAGVFLACALETLAASALHAQLQFLVGAPTPVYAFGHGEVLSATYHHRVGHAGKTPAEAQIMYGVEQIALAHAVVAEETVDFRREVERRLAYVLEVGECERPKLHISVAVAYFCSAASAAGRSKPSLVARSLMRLMRLAVSGWELNIFCT